MRSSVRSLGHLTTGDTHTLSPRTVCTVELPNLTLNNRVEFWALFYDHAKFN
jgi:hypothetical protein